MATFNRNHCVSAFNDILRKKAFYPIFFVIQLSLFSGRTKFKFFSQQFFVANSNGWESTNHRIFSMHLDENLVEIFF